MSAPEPFWRWSLGAIRNAIFRRDVSPVEVTEPVLRRIESRSHINAYITVLAEAALGEARARERTLLRGEPRGPLFGVPIALKDNIATAGARTTAGSPVLERWTPEKDAAVVQALRKAGAIVIGKNNLFEFAYGAAHPRFGETLNPWDPGLTCGGSSSGSAAAVADGQAFAAIGTDTGGSIRIPAAMCGIVGLKLSRGRVPNRGVIPVSEALDVVGPMTRSVDDAALVLAGMVGDAKPAGQPPGTLTIGIPSRLPGVRIAATLTEAVERARDRLLMKGCTIREIALPDLTLAREVMWTIASADAAEYHRDGLKVHASDFCEEVRRNLIGGTMVPAIDYIRARRLRRRLADEIAAAMQAVDAILMPSLSILPYRSGLQRVRVDGAEERVLPLVMAFTPLANLTGQPAVIVPVDAPTCSPPATVQFYGRPGREDVLLQVARLVERLSPFLTDVRPYGCTGACDLC